MADSSSLAQAFEWFTSAAGSLQNSYSMLQAELARLREELEVKNRDLARSLAQNRAMRAHLGRIMEGLPCGVLVVDSGFRLRFANRGAQRLLALDRRANASPGGAVPESLRGLLEEIIAEKPVTERPWLRSGGEDRRWIGVTCASLADDASTEDFLFILRDITEQKRLEEERESARRVQALAEMTALLAHEIRNPLGSLELFVGLIKDATADQPEVAAWVVHVQAGLRALSATVNNVLQFYAQAPPRTVRIDIVKLVAETLEFLRPLALQRSMGIVFAEPEEGVFVDVDPHRLQQVFFNLTINAFRAMSAGGVLTVRVNLGRQDSGRSVEISFEDQGVGISPANQERIFEAGFTTNRGSPGLGLAVCQRVVGQHGGTLGVRSSLGNGTTFTLTLPVPGAPA